MNENGEQRCKERAQQVAAKLQTVIPGDIQRAFWCVPIFEAMLKRIEELERAVKENVRA